GPTFDEADAAAQAKKAEEEGERFRDVKAEEDISPEIPAPPTDLGRFQVRPLEEGGFEVVNTDTGRRFGTTTRRDRAEELAEELSRGDFERIRRRRGETSPAEAAARPRVPTEGEPSMEERVVVEEFTDAEGETRFRVVDDATGQVLRRRDTREAAEAEAEQIIEIGALPGEPSAETQMGLQIEREQFPGRRVGQPRERGPTPAPDTPLDLARDLVERGEADREGQIEALREAFPDEVGPLTDRQILANYILQARRDLAEEGALEILGEDQIAEIQARARELLEEGNPGEFVAQRIRAEFPEATQLSVRRLRRSYIVPIEEEIQARRREGPAPEITPAEAVPTREAREVSRETPEGRERIETDAGPVEIAERIVGGRQFPGWDVYNALTGDFLGKVLPVDDGFSIMGAGVSGRGILPTRDEALMALAEAREEVPSVEREAPPPGPDTTEGRMLLPGGLIIDNDGGVAATGFNSNVNYRGFTLMLRPSEFAGFAGEMAREEEGRPEYFDQAQESGRGIASPFLEVRIPEDSESGGWEIEGHEGRHRMRWIQNRYGDIPIPVHFIPRGHARARHITDDMFRELLITGARKEPNLQVPIADQDLPWVTLGREITVFHDGQEKTFEPGEELEGTTEEEVQEEIQDRRREDELPGDVYNADPAEIDVEPERFQFKRDVGAEGVGQELKGVQRWDPNLAGILQVWRDPNDGRLKVINGHHRLDLAKRLGVGEVLVREVQAENAREARLIGALTNIAEGRGTPVDAAKLFRDEGITTEQLAELGISLRGQVAKLGTALSNLHQTISRDVATGRLPARRAAVMGGAELTGEQQLALYDMIRNLEERGRRPTNAEVEELIRFVRGAGETETTQE
ncbi:MAG: hypothetical protein ACLFWG_11945, partial [Longimicrobiales bacterium]